MLRDQACLEKDKHCSDTTCAGYRAGLGAGRIPALVPQAELHTGTPLQLWQQDHLGELGLLG